MANKVSVVLVGGGTGGHFYPLMSVADALRASTPNLTLTYIGPTPYDQPALTVQGVRYAWCPAGKRRRYTSFRNFIDLFTTAFGLMVALIKLYVIYPDAVVSKGGYTSVPIVLAAGFLKIPIIVHESDSVPGAANRLAARFAHSVFVAYHHMTTAFPNTETHFIGIPIRRELLQPPHPDVRAELGITNDLPTLFIVGGSQGAERINELILDSLDELLPRYNIVHQTGVKNYELTKSTAERLITDPALLSRYNPIAFVDAVTLNSIYHAADLVISRAGSTSIHEIAIHGKPAILIPIPEDISHDQRSNAYAYAREGGASVIEEGNLTDGLLQAEIERIMQNAELYADMSLRATAFARSDAATQISSVVNSIAADH